MNWWSVQEVQQLHPMMLGEAPPPAPLCKTGGDGWYMDGWLKTVTKPSFNRIVTYQRVDFLSPELIIATRLTSCCCLNELYVSIYNLISSLKSVVLLGSFDSQESWWDSFHYNCVQSWTVFIMDVGHFLARSMRTDQWVNPRFQQNDGDSEKNISLPFSWNQTSARWL